MKVLHWNAGNGWWESKRLEIETLIVETAPDIIFISEANLRTDTPAHLKDFQGYYMVTPPTDLEMGYSRIVLIAREGVHLTILNECMNGNIAAIWVQVTVRGKKPLLIGGAYREFHQLLQPPPP